MCIVPVDFVTADKFAPDAKVGAATDKEGIPAGLEGQKVPRDGLPKLADLAFQDACHTLNPRACTRDDLMHLYESAFDA